MTVINLLDPYSNFGRIMVNPFRPVAVGANNQASAMLEKTGNYSLPPFSLGGYHTDILLYVSIFFILVFFMAVINGRIYCNTLCPVGTLLGLISRVSLFRISFDRESCIRCDRCERVSSGPPGGPDFENLDKQVGTSLNYVVIFIYFLNWLKRCTSPNFCHCFP